MRFHSHVAVDCSHPTGFSPEAEYRPWIKVVSATDEINRNSHILSLRITRRALSLFEKNQSMCYVGVKSPKASKVPDDLTVALLILVDDLRVDQFSTALRSSVARQLGLTSRCMELLTLLLDIV
ncbi:hypothetical protein EAF00_004431 [Botryotinia globosa]|nr:hypothetical protein EAF00_004431 [Botryotinia globosa]